MIGKGPPSSEFSKDVIHLVQYLVLENDFAPH